MRVEMSEVDENAGTRAGLARAAHREWAGCRRGEDWRSVESLRSLMPAALARESRDDRRAQLEGGSTIGRNQM